MSDSIKRSRRSVKDDMLQANERINELVSADMWEEVEQFYQTCSAGRMAELHEILKDQVDALLLKVLRAIYDKNAIFILRSAPEPVRIMALLRLKIASWQLQENSKKTQPIDRAKAFLAYYLFSDIPARVHFCYVNDLSNNPE